MRRHLLTEGRKKREEKFEHRFRLGCEETQQIYFSLILLIQKISLWKGFVFVFFTFLS